MNQMGYSKPVQVDFWSSNPCGTTGSLEKRINHRFSMEPWIPAEVSRFPKSDTRYLEVGSGQGTDAYSICSMLEPTCEYVAVDYSTESVRLAEEALAEAKGMFDLSVVPSFQQADALALPFPSDHFDYVYSLGVLHHTPDPQAGVDEIYRVLKDGGEATVLLYRFGSPKVGVAKSLRLLQRCVDFVLRTDRVFYKLLRRAHRSSDSLGTMLLECFGVPWMYWYSKNDMYNLFGAFEILSLEPYGYNFPKGNKIREGKNPIGYFYRIHARKSAENGERGTVNT